MYRGVQALFNAGAPNSEEERGPLLETVVLHELAKGRVIG
jgi:hypothetical protein